MDSRTTVMETEAAVAVTDDSLPVVAKEGAEDVAVSPPAAVAPAEKRQNDGDDPGESGDDPPEKKVRMEEPQEQPDQVNSPIQNLLQAKSNA